MATSLNKGIKTDFNFREFLKGQQSAGIVLILCTIVSLALANSPYGGSYTHFWEIPIGIHINAWSLEHHILEWVNDGLMAIFFLFVGLEIKREFATGELSNIKVALLPILVALGGMLVPGLLYTLVNLPEGGNTRGFGIPMATDIAFALGVLSLLGDRVPANLKVFLMALAVIDDLGAILVIAVFYGGKFSLEYALLCTATFALLLLINRLKVRFLSIYLILGLLLWYFMLHSGVHATIAGVLLALAIPFDVQYTSKYTLPAWLVHYLHYPINFVIMPLFAIANTAIMIHFSSLTQVNYLVCLGIFVGLFVGKVLGIFGATFIAVKTNLSKLPTGVVWTDVIGMGFLGGIGFTMSIFVATLAFTDDAALVDNSKLVIIISSTLSGLVGYFFLHTIYKRQHRHAVQH